MEMIDKYTYRIQWSDDDEAYLASCLEFPSLMTHGETQAEALEEMNNVLSFVLVDLSQKGKQAPKPIKDRKFKGNISLRLPPETHEDLAYIATEQDLSLNQCITTIIEKNLYANTIMDSVKEAGRPYEDRSIVVVTSCFWFLLVCQFVQTTSSSSESFFPASGIKRTPP